MADEDPNQDEPIRTIRETTVETRDDARYEASSVKLYPHYVRIFTSRDQPHTDPEVWVPTENVTEIGAEYSNPI